MNPLTETPAGRAFHRTALELATALAEARRRAQETERFLVAMARRPLSRPESRLTK